MQGRSSSLAIPPLPGNAWNTKGSKRGEISDRNVCDDMMIHVYVFIHSFIWTGTSTVNIAFRVLLRYARVNL